MRLLNKYQQVLNHILNKYNFSDNKWTGFIGGASDYVNNFLVIPNPAGPQNVSCLLGIFIEKPKLNLDKLLVTIVVF